MSPIAISQSLGGVMAVVGLVTFAAAAVVIWRLGRKPKEQMPDIPGAMKPGPSDADLEKPRFEALQAWGIVLVLFFAVWLPIYFLAEPTANRNQEKALTTDSIQRGKEGVELFSEENPGGIGCVRCHGPDLEGGKNLFTAPGQTQALIVPVPNLHVVCDHLTLDELKNTIMQGRPGTDMPSWSIRYQGPLDDQQISDLVQYIVSVQTVPYDKNKCINPKAASPAPAAPTSGAASPGASPSASPAK